MTPQQIQQKLSKGDEVRFKNGLILYYVGPKDSITGWFKENHGSTNTVKQYKYIEKIQGRPINEQKMEFKKLLKNIWHNRQALYLQTYAERSSADSIALYLQTYAECSSAYAIAL